MLSPLFKAFVTARGPLWSRPKGSSWKGRLHTTVARCFFHFQWKQLDCLWKDCFCNLRPRPLTKAGHAGQAKAEALPQDLFKGFLSSAGGRNIKIKGTLINKFPEAIAWLQFGQSGQLSSTLFGSFSPKLRLRTETPTSAVCPIRSYLGENRPSWRDSSKYKIK